ncbi:Sec-independent protein translocase protein TatB [Devosia limi]|uniref:Sec-independent protein translocase protein TatB n=1 Tax=Devosia limi DSM 17137 TaxID=1121477 RepID=A0A1M4VR69_9HYPH|nr:Sec-independent protein translocase protein TatB [Devosia limi]SHE71347.1 sec-independent protein translocase protein TatB [Devosia limi DSM 17137]
MLGLGWTEMLVIGIAALIFVGPKDLPVVMSRAGKIIGQIRRMGNEFQREINKTTGLDEVRNLRNSITAPLKKTTDEIRKEFNAMTPTGVQPSGVIKPADPKAESVVDEIRAAAGMPAVSPPAVPRTNDEIAAEAGFKPSAKPVAAAKPAAVRKAPVKANPAPTRPVITTDLKPVAPEPMAEAPAKAAVAKKPTARKPAARKPAAAAKPAAEAKPAAAKKPAAKKAPAAAKPAASAAEKPARKAPAASAPVTADAAKAEDE